MQSYRGFLQRAFRRSSYCHGMSQPPPTDAYAFVVNRHFVAQRVEIDARSARSVHEAGVRHPPRMNQELLVVADGVDDQRVALSGRSSRRSSRDRSSSEGCFVGFIATRRQSRFSPSMMKTRLSSGRSMNSMPFGTVKNRIRRPADARVWIVDPPGAPAFVERAQS